MKRITLGCCSLIAALALLPGAAVAKPNSTDKQNAAKECKELRAGMGVAAFRQLYGSPAGAKNAFGKCVSKFAREEEQQREQAHSNAAKDCKAEREADPAAFNAKYGKNESDKNAYGKCVSMKAKENKQEADEADAKQDEETINSARTCRAEQKADPDAFRDKYGTGPRKRNAFGKCVSQTSRDNTES